MADRSARGGIRYGPDMSDENTYALYYWPAIPGRGEPVRLTFHLGGIEYVDVARQEGAGAITKFLKGGEGPFAPPFVVHDEDVFWQTANLCDLIARRHGMVDDEEAPRALQLMMTIMDVFAEAHDTHHPVATGLYYDDQKDAAKANSKAFREERIPKYLDFFESHLEGGTLLGDELSYVDAALWHLHEGLQYAFPKAMKSYGDRWPRIAALDEAVHENERLAAYLDSDDRMEFNENGIFRHYPELDAAGRTTE